MHYFNKGYLLTCLLLYAFTANAQVISLKLDNKSVSQYHKAEFNIKLKSVWQNPYLQEQVTVDMALTSPKGKQLKLPCFYESGERGKIQTWKARFTPQERGLYTYHIELKDIKVASVKSKIYSFTAGASKSNGFLHPNNNWTFKFDNGKLFRGIGENIGWESRTSDDSKYLKELHQQPKYNYDYMLRSLARHGGNFFRTWICRWNLPLDWHDNFNNTRYQPSNAYFNPSAIRRMDKLVNLSDSLNVYMMLTLGMGAYEIKDGGFSPTAADFFVNPRSKERYKNRLRYIIARWGYSPSIAAWELFNEVDNVQFADKEKLINADSIVAWHDEMSAYIKSIDPYQHMVTTSISHRDLAGLNSLKNIDFNQKHIYKNTAAIPSTIIKYETEFKKPYVIGEYGYEWDWNKNFDDFAPQMDSDFKRGLCYGLFSPTPILPMSWWWEYFDSRGTDKYFAKIKRVNKLLLDKGQPIEQAEVNSTDAGIKTMGVKCGNQLFLYVYNPGGATRNINLELTGKQFSESNGTLYAPENETLGLLPPFPYTNGKTIITVPLLKANEDVIYIINQKQL